MSKNPKILIVATSHDNLQGEAKLGFGCPNLQRLIKISSIKDMR